MEFATQLVKEMQELSKKYHLSQNHFLSRSFEFRHLDENFITHIMTSFILAGHDTTTVSCVQFFWLVVNQPEVKNKNLKEINEKSEASITEK